MPYSSYRSTLHCVLIPLPQKLPLPVWDLDSHLIHCSLAQLTHHPKRHLDWVTIFAWNHISLSNSANTNGLEQPSVTWGFSNSSTSHILVLDVIKYLHTNRNAHMATISTVMPKLKDFSRSQSVTYIAKEVIICEKPYKNGQSIKQSLSSIFMISFYRSKLHNITVNYHLSLCRLRPTKGYNRVTANICAILWPWWPSNSSINQESCTNRLIQ